ncbi:hypothetical protein F5146DRAFT_1009824 [Armillaria mellea]|nr:hypothetical protein F5146DRAFT_1009820 [Armillaria mellea]KAK0183573.1 hypothetical protein F5146DRAFT_1009824 [Armillaria mellea]
MSHSFFLSILLSLSLSLSLSLLFLHHDTLSDILPFEFDIDRDTMQNRGKIDSSRETADTAILFLDFDMGQDDVSPPNERPSKIGLLGGSEGLARTFLGDFAPRQCIIIRRARPGPSEEDWVVEEMMARNRCEETSRGCARTREPKGRGRVENRYIGSEMPPGMIERHAASNKVVKNSNNVYFCLETTYLRLASKARTCSRAGQSDEGGMSLGNDDVSPSGGQDWRARGADDEGKSMTYRRLVSKSKAMSKEGEDGCRHPATRKWETCLPSNWPLFAREKRILEQERSLKIRGISHVKHVLGRGHSLRHKQILVPKQGKEM